MNEEPRIIFENEEMMVLDKPAGLTVNRSDTTTGEKTLQDWIENKIKNQRSKIKNEEKETDFYKRAGPPATHAFALRAGIVHRLDKETSGIILIAKTKAAFENLQSQFKERRVEKTYVALVHGEVTPKDGEINVPVGRLSWNRKRFGVVAGGREAVTKYKVLSVFGSRLSDVGLSVNRFIGQTDKQIDQKLKTDPLRLSEARNRKPTTEYSLLELYPKTGRTHQIRVHLKYIGHPIFSDHLYGGRKQARDDRKILPRIFLHAAKISFFDPKTGLKINFESKLPDELERLIESQY
ncbi:MAG: RluA family pseudouridine synthase [Patescibacteria group bacterium]|nr:RluA family pseudouridine synthase [Patescibacteria group bacterium]